MKSELSEEAYFLPEKEAAADPAGWSLRAFADIGRLHITAIAAMGVFTFGWLFTGSYPWFLTAVCALDWFVVNLVNRIVDLREDWLNNIRHTASVSQYRRPLLLCGAGLLGTSLLGVHLINPAITPLRIAGHLLGIFYNFPLLPGKRRLKEIYFLKNISSGAGFLVTVFGYPLATALAQKGGSPFPQGISWMTVGFSGIFFLLFIQSYEIIYDLRDIAGDRAAGIRTYPVVHGEKTAVCVIDSLIGAALVVIGLGYVLEVVPWRIFIMSAAPVLQLGVYKHALHRRDPVAGCIRLTWMGVLLFIIYHIWILADLPGADF